MVIDPQDRASHNIKFDRNTLALEIQPLEIAYLYESTKIMMDGKDEAFALLAGEQYRLIAFDESMLQWSFLPASNLSQASKSLVIINRIIKRGERPTNVRAAPPFRILHHFRYNVKNLMLVNLSVNRSIITTQ
ncbi:hypothetical protein EYC80_009133 [Monilinia laxa]|uniref:Uncharacterized protein n=1 Tax=Monilinia laxa TaxID=61186 RepID=A0A5N6K2P2_MONLA|nr:hypothetical protein EYC80_009133 [Monilinia laxa]